MAFIVEMLRNCGGDRSRAAEFACSAARWRRFRELAQESGWTPEQARYDDQSPYPDHESGQLTDYEPEEWRYAKCVSAPDAASMARALTSVLSSVRSGAIPDAAGPALLSDFASAAAITQVHAPFAEALEAFIAFAAGGGFIFAWDD
ncbi:MAG: hypothetical protein ACREXP_31010 [Steroidobacteraceae bacterium]